MFLRSWNGTRNRSSRNFRSRGRRPTRARAPARLTGGGSGYKIEEMPAKGDLRLRLDSGRTVTLNVREHPHLDYGYAVTSHSSQGQTAGRVLGDIDMERAA